MNLSNEQTARIAGHLAHVGKNLKGYPPAEQKEILQSIEAHIHDALESKGGANPSDSLLEAVLAEMDPPESYSQIPADDLLPPKSRPWSKRWWTQIAIWIVLAVVIRTFFLQAFRVATDAAAPELPRGSHCMVWKISRNFAPGDLITYKYKEHVNVGRIARIENETLWVNRNAEPEMAILREAIIGKVICVPWRASNRIASGSFRSSEQPTETTPVSTGRWESVDVVSSIEQFDPEVNRWRGDLVLKDITFMPDGKTDRLYWTWAGGILHHSGDNTDAKLLIKRISGAEYLFLEWITGEVIRDGVPPNYYVLKKQIQNEPETLRSQMNKPLIRAAASIIATTNLVAGELKTGSPAQAAIRSTSSNASIATPPAEVKRIPDGVVAKQKDLARRRMGKDSEIYSQDELQDIESLYQVANKNWNSQEAQDSLKKLISNYSAANRTGCALLYLGQMSSGDEQINYLKQAIKTFSDCFYGDGVQVGAYARFVLWDRYSRDGEQEKAAKLAEEIVADYPDAIDHRGIRLVEFIKESPNQ